MTVHRARRSTKKPPSPLPKAKASKANKAPTSTSTKAEPKLSFRQLQDALKVAMKEKKKSDFHSAEEKAKLENGTIKEIDPQVLEMVAENDRKYDAAKESIYSYIRTCKYGKIYDPATGDKKLDDENKVHIDSWEKDHHEKCKTLLQEISTLKDNKLPVPKELQERFDMTEQLADLDIDNATDVYLKVSDKMRAQIFLGFEHGIAEAIKDSEYIQKAYDGNIEYDDGIDGTKKWILPYSVLKFGPTKFNEVWLEVVRLKNSQKFISKMMKVRTSGEKLFTRRGYKTQWQKEHRATTATQKMKKKKPRIWIDEEEQNKENINKRSTRPRRKKNDLHKEIEVAHFRRIKQSGPGREISIQTADGNCLYYSLSDVVFEDGGANWQYIKSWIMNEIKTNHEVYQPFLCDDEPINDYVDKKKQDGEYGDNIEIMAAARLFATPIKIFQTNGGDRIVTPDFDIKDFVTTKATTIQIISNTTIRGSDGVKAKMLQIVSKMEYFDSTNAPLLLSLKNFAADDELHHFDSVRSFQTEEEEAIANDFRVRSFQTKEEDIAEVEVEVSAMTDKATKRNVVRKASDPHRNVVRKASDHPPSILKKTGASASLKSSHKVSFDSSCLKLKSPPSKSPPSPSDEASFDSCSKLKSPPSPPSKSLPSDEVGAPGPKASFDSCSKLKSPPSKSPPSDEAPGSKALIVRSTPKTPGPPSRSTPKTPGPPSPVQTPLQSLNENGNIISVGLLTAKWKLKKRKRSLGQRQQSQKERAGYNFEKAAYNAEKASELYASAAADTQKAKEEIDEDMDDLEEFHEFYNQSGAKDRPYLESMFENDILKPIVEAEEHDHDDYETEEGFGALSEEANKTNDPIVDAHGAPGGKAMVPPNPRRIL